MAPLIPSTWKTYLIYPFIKRDKDQKLCDSYRPIALCSCAGKVLHAMVKNRLEWLVENKNILPQLQSAFRKGRSVVDNVIYLTWFVQLSFSRGTHTLAVLLDIKSAFDSVEIFHSPGSFRFVQCSATAVEWEESFLCCDCYTNSSHRAKSSNSTTVKIVLDNIINKDL